MSLTATFLTDGGQSAGSVAALLAEHLALARQSVDIAIYDLKLNGAPGDIVRQAVHEAQARGVSVRLVFNQEKVRTRPLPPPGFVDYEYLRRLQVESHAVPGVP